jgi:pSer/pThr/pTyr-binding forkhead associated (FHA) protein
MDFELRLKRIPNKKKEASQGEAANLDGRHTPSSDAAAKTASPPSLWIEFLHGSRNGESLELRGNRWKIGTAPDCAILFDIIMDSEVNDHHAEIVYHEEQYWILPAASSRTWLNGALLNRHQKLKTGDKLTLGAEHGPEICIHLPGEKNSSSHTIPPVHVRVEKGDALKRWGRFERNFTLGRSKACDIQFNDSPVSMHHARIMWDGTRWVVEDLQSTNGTYLNGTRIQRVALPPHATLELTRGGPLIACEIEQALPLPTAERSVTEIARRYFDKSAPDSAGEHTMLIRQAFHHVRRKHAKRYWMIIGVIMVLLIGTAGALYYQSQRLKKQEEMHALAENVFYAMKALELQLAALQAAAAQHPDSQLQKQLEEKRQQQRQLLDSYSNFARDELGISQDELTEEEWLIYKVARLFGECDVSMPAGFVQTVKKYISMWRSTERFRKAIQRATANGYAAKIAQAMLAHDLPPQFFYLALQETDFDVRRCGPRTRHGIAKGLWQFIPGTAIKYGLRTGPLLEWRRYDPRDERHDFEKSTLAAAQYLHDIYKTEAQASGLLVMACYNWGENNIEPLIQQMPANPRERNFWKMLALHDQIPKQTYDYVFYIIAAAVIGENPRLFGFDFENPLKLE